MIVVVRCDKKGPRGPQLHRNYVRSLFWTRFDWRDSIFRILFIGYKTRKNGVLEFFAKIARSKFVFAVTL